MTASRRSSCHQPGRRSRNLLSPQDVELDDHTVVFRAFQREVETSLQPQAILRELREGDYLRVGAMEAISLPWTGAEFISALGNIAFIAQ
jgi:hypothetical protein